MSNDDIVESAKIEVKVDKLNANVIEEKFENINKIISSPIIAQKSQNFNLVPV